MTSNIQYTFLAEIRPWTITQADIEGYETIHADGEIVLGDVWIHFINSLATQILLLRIKFN